MNRNAVSTMRVKAVPTVEVSPEILPDQSRGRVNTGRVAPRVSRSAPTDVAQQATKNRVGTAMNSGEWRNIDAGVGPRVGGQREVVYDRANPRKGHAGKGMASWIAVHAHAGVEVPGLAAVN